MVGLPLLHPRRGRDSTFTAYGVARFALGGKYGGKMSREQWATGPNAMHLQTSLEKDPQCIMKCDADCHGRLRSVMRSTAEQQLMARKYSGIVV